MATQKIETGLIADSAVTTAKIADNSVTGAKIAAASLDDQVKGISSSADAVAITIDSSEKVGIGTSTTDGMLTIKKTGSNIFGDSAITIQSADTDPSTLALGLTGSVAYVDSTESDSGTVLPLVFATASAERIRIDTLGNIGFGTSSPNNYSGYTTLTFNNATYGGAIEFENNGTRVGTIFSDQTSTILKTVANVPLLFGTNDAEKMRIDSSGNVGIGMTPTYRLDVTNNSTGIQGRLSSSSSSGTSLSFQNSATNGRNYRIGSNFVTGAGEFAIYDDTASAERMRITSDGAVVVNNSGGDAQIYLGGTSGTSRMYLARSSADSLLWNVSNGNLRFGTNDAERVRIDSAGTIFQGTTTPTLHSAVRGIVFENGSIINDVTRAAGRSITLAQNAAVDSGNTWAYLATDEASYYQQFNGNHYFATAPSGSAGSDVTFDTKMLISNSGTTTFYNDAQVIKTSAGGNGGAFLIRNGSSSSGSYCRLYLSPTASDATSRGTIIQAENTDGNNNMALVFKVSAGSDPAEHMRILSSGDITFKCGANTPSSSVVGWRYNAANSAYPWVKSSVGGSGGLTHYQFYNTNGAVGQIFTSGSGTTFATSSDYRLKENVDYTWDATTRLKQLKPARFNFKADADTIVDGFLAHEVQNIVPEAIYGVKDGVDKNGEPDYQCIDQSKLVPLLVKTIQELEARIAALES